MKKYCEFQKYFEDTIKNIRDLKHKGNNQLFHVSTDSGEFILKQYAEFHMDNWQRGETEFKSLNYLWEKGFREIPRPIKFDKEDNVAVYSYETGKILNPSEVREKDIKISANFLVKLHNLGNKDKINFSPACSACLNLQEYINVLDRRVRGLFNYEPKDIISKKAKYFFDERVTPKIEELKRIFYQDTNGYDLKKELTIEEQVLTPADWGFHNILHNNGKYKFIDFEYFGRDDSVRQVLDFIHHVNSFDIKPELKNLFLKVYKKGRNVSKEFDDRLNLVNPLIAMTWTLIPLNIFCKERMEKLDLTKKDSIERLEARLFNAEKKFNLEF